MREFRKAFFQPAVFASAAIGIAGMPVGAAANCDTGAVTYRMQSGDSLFLLNQRYLRGVGAMAQIASLNGIRNPRRIPVGTPLRIPRRLLRFSEITLTVEHVSGRAEIGTSQAERGTRVGLNDTIQTLPGSFLTLTSDDPNTRVTVPANSRARLVCSRRYALDNLRDVQFQIESGRASIRAPALNEGERFRTSTPVAVTAVRGTEYRVSFNEESEIGTTEVEEGTVAVAAASDDSSEALPEAGFGVAASPEGVGEVEQLLPPPSVDSAGAVQTGEFVEFAITPPDGAVATRTQIARDGGFQEIIAEQITADGPVSFPELEDGRYFFRTRGIAENGLEGLSDEVAPSFRRKRLGVAATSEPSPLADGFRFVWQAQGEGTSQFAFQLWREGEAGTPLFDEIGLPGNATVVTGLEPGTYVWRVAVLQTIECEETDEGCDGLLKVWGPEQPFSVSAE